MKKNKGFTLIEVVISIAIISIVGLSVMQMFTTSSKVNRKSKEIDHANLKATSIIEKIKNNPDNYAKNMKLNKEKLIDKDGRVVTNEKEAKSSESEYEKIIYYDYHWNEVSDVNKAKFKSTVKLNKKVNYGEHSDFNPRKYGATGNRDPVIDGTTDQYLIIVLNPPATYVDHPDTYEFYIINDYTKKSYLEWLYAEQGGYKDLYIRKRLSEGHPYSSIIGWFQSIKDRGLNDLLIYAVRDMQDVSKTTVENTESEDRAIDSIPFPVDIKNLDKKQNIEFFNVSNKTVDIYINSDSKEKVEQNINFTSSDGVFSKTYLSDERKHESNFDVEVKVTPIDSNKNLAKLQVKKYRAN